MTIDTPLDDYVTCPSQKVVYVSSQAAKRDVRSIVASNRRNSKKPGRPYPRIYQCDRCWGWHITTSYRR